MTRFNRTRAIAALAIGIALGGTAIAHPEAPTGKTQAVAAVPPSVRPAAAVVDAFHAALRRGDTAAAQSHLADGALIYESGGVERGRKEYASHHLDADAAFAQAVPGSVTRRAGEAAGNIAWVATEGRTAGTYKGKAVDRITTETMILRRVGRAWKIVHIHWSSAAGGK
jgi:ketosteroid isomerase-like protein